MPMTFTTLTGDKSVAGSIRSWQNYGKVDAEGVLEEAEAMTYQRLRVREMRSSTTLTIPAAAASIALPTGFLDPLVLRDITNSCDIELRAEEWMESIRTWTNGELDDGDPAFYGIYDELFQFDCKTTVEWQARALFYKRGAALSAENETNFLTDRYPHVLRMACLATAARFSHDDDMFAREQRLFEAKVDELNAMDEFSRRGQENPVRS